MAITLSTDLFVPEPFAQYIQQETEAKSRLIQSGAVVADETLNTFLAGGGLTVALPSQKDIDDADNVSGQSVADSQAWTALSGTAVGANYPTLNDALPFKTSASTEIAVRLSRNNGWSEADLAKELSGTDPLGAIAGRLSAYWARRIQAAYVAAWSGAIKDNTANDSGDYTVDISGAGYTAGVTDFSASALIDAATTAGDSADMLTMLMVHSVVYSRMQKNNLIDFIPDSNGVVNIPTFLGRQVIVDDTMPRSTNVYDSWLFGAGATKLGSGTPVNPLEIERKAAAGNGGGQTILWSRRELAIHPVGHAFVAASPAVGGPGNGTTANNLNHVSSWNRALPERKQVRFARLVTREA